MFNLRRKLQRNKSRGFTFTEALLSASLLSAAVLIAIMGWRANDRSTITQSQIQGVVGLVNNINRALAPHPENLSRLSGGLVLRMNLSPTQFKNRGGSRIVNRWDRGVLVDPSADGMYYTVTFIGFPTYACVDFVQGVAASVDVIHLHSSESSTKPASAKLVKEKNKHVDMIALTNYCRTLSASTKSTAYMDIY